MEPVSLTAGRLHLRPWEPWDADEVFAACQDPEVPRWTRVPSPYTREDARQFVEQVQPQGWADGTTAGFAVLDATTARLHGSVSLMGIADGSAEIGYWTAPGSRGQGFTAEAVGVVCRWGFGGLGLERVLWQAEVGNWGSRAVAESVGFTVEGTLRGGLPRRGGGRVDVWTGSLLAGDEPRDRRAFGGRWRDLSGDGLLLRRLRDDDVDGVREHLSDPQSAHRLPTPSARADAGAFVAGTREEWAAGRAASLAVEEDGRFVGLVLLGPSPLDPELAEVGCWTSPGARGRRVSSRAVRLLVGWAAGLGVQRFEATVDVEDSAAHRAAERAGFVREGVRRAGLRPSPSSRDGRRRDGVLYALVV